MKVITESMLRVELKTDEPEVYYIPEGKMLSPAAREYLQMRKIKISKEKPPAAPAANAPKRDDTSPSAPVLPQGVRYVDDETGAFYTEKPEHMTQLHGNMLVCKSDPRIVFRGKLDSLQAQFVLVQAAIAEDHGSQKLLDDLSDVLSVLTEMMRCDVLNLPFHREKILGLTHAQLRERSHDPQKFFHIKQMQMPHYTMGKQYALLNLLRTQIRETEVAAETAFRNGRKTERPGLIEELNRLSSAMHIMMCMYLAGMYSSTEGGGR